MSAEYYLETIQKVFLEHPLPRGCMEVAGRPVRLTAITNVAVLTIEGRRDAGQGQTEATHALFKGIPAYCRQHVTVDGAEHYGVVAGRKFRKFIVPSIARVVRAHGRKCLP